MADSLQKGIAGRVEHLFRAVKGIRAGAIADPTVRLFGNPWEPSG